MSEEPTPVSTPACSAISAQISVAERNIDTVCVVCLQSCQSKACNCSWMHQECATKYRDAFGLACKVCDCEFEPARLSKRRIEGDEAELEQIARKRARERAAAEQAENVQWAQIVAPSAAQILLRHYLYTEDVTRSDDVIATPLCFDSVVLSLVHSGEQYLEDLSERLSDTQPPSVVESAVRRLRSLADELTGDGIDATCATAFMRIFNQVLERRLGQSSPDDSDD
eukprot:scaffold13002_cov125-Isochrysis_galbana.AAC.12